jgi:hypothetical protein
LSGPKYLIVCALVAGCLTSRGGDGAIDWEAAREFWAFRKPVPHAAPTVGQVAWPRTKTDRFILAGLEAAGLHPNPPATRAQLFRRVSFDLTGLPPSPADVTAFVRSAEPAAYENWVAELLGSRAFGERMASLWLNVARYAEDQAHLVGKNTSLAYPNAYKYREWLIAAFNRDLPYDEFIQGQLAADLSDSPAESDLPALGFLGLGHKYYQRNRLEVQAEEWAEKVDTVSRAFLGLTIACAQCHDHKYDPITMEDYYGLAGVFANIKMVNKTPDGFYEESKTLAEDMRKETMHLVEDVGSATNLAVFARGDVTQPGAVVARRFPRILSDGSAPVFEHGSGRRELADLIASRDNPLTARVLVNRVWTAMFGRGLVGTPGNFGQLGDRPTHPELLDDLAVRFMENGWSVKWLVRELALSAVYRQSSQALSEGVELDEDNRLWWRMNRRRLSIEQFRDSLLAVTGDLDAVGGPSLELSDPANLRRTVYARVSRRELDKTMMLFDYPDANVHVSARSVSTTAPQKLFVLNSPFVIARAKSLAVRLTAEADNDSDRVVAAFRLLYARPPAEVESALALNFLTNAVPDGLTPWEQYAQALLAANEMMYLD